MNTPSVTIIICVGPNHERYAKDAVYSCLNQDSLPNEILVVKDLEAEEPKGIPEHGIIRRLNSDKHGKSSTFNYGLLRATSDWLYHLGADDVLQHYAVTAFRHLATDMPDVSLFYADYLSSVGESLARSPRIFRQTKDFDRERLRYDMIGNMGCFFRTSRMIAIGGYDEKYNLAGQDYDFWLRYCLNPKVKVYKHSQPFLRARKRIHSIPRAGRHWELACNRIRKDVANGEYESWVTR